MFAHDVKKINEVIFGSLHMILLIISKSQISKSNTCINTIFNKYQVFIIFSPS